MELQILIEFGYLLRKKNKTESLPNTIHKNILSCLTNVIGKALNSFFKKCLYDLCM